MPVPVPSSPIITFVMFSSRSSITTTSEAPARSAFLTFVTKEQLPRSTRTILVANASCLGSNGVGVIGSSEPTGSSISLLDCFFVLVYKDILWQPSMLFLSK